MLHGGKHCAVQLLLPLEQFGQLNVLHLPNKNYRRVGRKGRIGGVGSSIENKFATGDEQFEAASNMLLTAMDAHLALRKAYPAKKKESYTGIKMIAQSWGGQRSNLRVRMKAYDKYVANGGVMSDEDFISWNWSASDK